MSDMVLAAFIPAVTAPNTRAHTLNRSEPTLNSWLRCDMINVNNLLSCVWFSLLVQRERERKNPMALPSLQANNWSSCCPPCWKVQWNAKMARKTPEWQKSLSIIYNASISSSMTSSIWLGHFSPFLSSPLSLFFSHPWQWQQGTNFMHPKSSEFAITFIDIKDSFLSINASKYCKHQNRIVNGVSYVSLVTCSYNCLTFPLFPLSLYSPFAYCCWCCSCCCCC